MKIEIYNLMQRYVDICCKTLNKQDFETILSKKVQLKHQTNEEIPIFAAGKKDVVELFQKYIFANTSDIDLLAVAYKEIKGKYLLKLQVVENKDEEGKINRYFFYEKTVFYIKEKKKEPKQYKITFIDTNVKKKSS